MACISDLRLAVFDEKVHRLLEHTSEEDAVEAAVINFV
jgi:hypothetical protein